MKKLNEQKEMVAEAMQAIATRKPGRCKLVYDKTKRAIVAVSTEQAFLSFKVWKDTGKTKIWDVTNNENSAWLGWVKWYAPWRKYCFFPYKDTVFCSKCLSEIVSFMQEQMELRKGEKEKR